MLNDRRLKSSVQHEQPSRQYSPVDAPHHRGGGQYYEAATWKTFRYFWVFPSLRTLKVLENPWASANCWNLNQWSGCKVYYLGNKWAYSNYFKIRTLFLNGKHQKKYKKFHCPVALGKPTFKKVLLMKVFLVVMFLIYVTSHCFLVTFMHENELKWWNC